MNSSHQNKHVQTAKKIANLLDAQFSIFGIRFGLDAVIGIIPGLGDIVTLILSGYIIYIALLLGVPSLTLVRMIGYIVLDFLVSLVPLLGGVFDIYFKANLKNIRLLEDFLKETEQS